MQTLQAQLSSLKKSSRTLLAKVSSGDERSPESRTSVVESSGERSIASSSSLGAASKDESEAIAFFDLLRPLQNSLSCASLMSEWTGDEDVDAHSESKTTSPGDATLNTSERDRSRMLRICCSVDNLLLSIGSRVQQEKHNEAIARGAARELLELFQFAIKQVAAATTAPLDASATVEDTTLDNNSSSASDATDKELLYMHEFIVEVAERMGKLDQFVRSTLLSELRAVRNALSRSEQANAELALVNTQLETEMADLRDFHAQNSVTVLGFASTSGSGASNDNNNNNNSEDAPSDSQSTQSDDASYNARRMSSLFPTTAAVAKTERPDASMTESDALQQLRDQCDEFARLLEMAKQEIRLCHREHEVQKSKIAELSSAAFKDEELAALRGQLQSEKRRVKHLESENVTLREHQIDQTMKIQSLLANSSSSASHVQQSIPTRQQSAAQDGEAAVSTPARPRLEARRGSVSIMTDTSTSKGGATALTPVDAKTRAEAGLTRERSVSMLASTMLVRQSSNSSGSGTTPPSSPKRQDQTAAQASRADNHSTSAHWFRKMLGLSGWPHQQHTTEPASRKKPPALVSAETDTPAALAEQKQFLASLLMTDKQLAATQIQTKTRRQGNVPTTAPPLTTSVSTTLTSTQAAGTTVDSRASGQATAAPAMRKTKKPSAGPTSDSDAAQLKLDTITVCEQLIWVFYQRFLMAEEAQSLLPRSSSSSQRTASLASVVLHYFLERKAGRPSDDTSALQDAARFVQCLETVKRESGAVRFFCDFLDGSRSREELCFYLWVLQVIDATTIGIAYDTPVAVVDESGSVASSAVAGTVPHICTLKATFLTRVIYRLFHVSALKRATRAPATSPLTKSASRKSVSPGAGSGSTRAIVTPPSSPGKRDQTSPSPRSTSPRKKLKSRMSDDAMRALANQPNQASATNEAAQAQSPLDHARESFQSAVALNGGAPLTLEAFNAIILHFAVAPSLAELHARLGPFFHPTGDEKKLELSIFLALLLELFANQLAWRKRQMQRLFIALAQKLEADELARERLARKRAEAVAASKGGRSAKTSQSLAKASAGSGAPQKGKKTSKSTKTKSKSKKKKKREQLDADNVKYLTGLSRTLLGQFVVHAGLVRDTALVDIDQLFVDVLELSGRSAREIHFDDLYNALERLHWLENRELLIDPTTAVLNQHWHATEDDTRARMLTSLRDIWCKQARQSLALCEHDPNTFVRRRARLLSDAISDHFAMSSSSVPSLTYQHFWLSLQSIRDFLALAWRVAAKRASECQVTHARDTARCMTSGNNQRSRASSAPHWFLSECYFLNQAILVVAADFRGYGCDLSTALSSRTSQRSDTSSLTNRSNETSLRGAVSVDTVGDTRDLRAFWDTSRMRLDDLLAECVGQRVGEKQAQATADVQSMVRELELVLQRFCVYHSHLFASYSSAAFTSSGVGCFDWLRLARELKCADKKLPDTDTARELFFRVYSSSTPDGSSSDTSTHLHDVSISKSQFTELLVRVAFSKALARREKKLRALPASLAVSSRRACALPGPSQIVATFCDRVVVPNAFQPRARLQEVDFVGKLSCPLVARMLLEHRAFLRAVFFYFAKQDGDDDDNDSSNSERPESASDGAQQYEPSTSLGLHGFQLGKTKRNSMNFDEFLAFLDAFELLQRGDYRSQTSTSRGVVDLDRAQLVFRSVMALENGDTTQMEFEEFAAASAALAVFRDPSPFRLWHHKIDAFVHELQRGAAHKELCFD